LKWLILDANVVIHLHEFGIWSKLVTLCDVHLPRTVVCEADFYEAEGVKKYIELEDDIDQQRVHVFDVPVAEIKKFREQFDSFYIDGLDPGESEALAYLCQQAEKFLVSSGDAIVYRVLGRLNRRDQGVSLEEILQKVGLKQKQLPWSCSKAFREKYTKEGEIHAIQGMGLKK
jgi:hypothetical protein